jgi:hypothetical protein
MLTIPQNIAFVIGTVVVAMGFIAILNRVWPWQDRRDHNDLIGWQLSVLGTTYAVILGFMLYTVWTTFGAADQNADLEADAVVNVYMLAEGLPEPQHTQMQKLALAYADTVVSQDWPQMAKGLDPEQSVIINADMWRTLMSVHTASPTEITAEDHALYELSALTEHRRIRLLQSNSRLPGVLWWVLLAGGTLTIMSSCMFGSASAKLHALQVFSFSLLIALSLVAVADINRPFQGAIHVSDFAFRRAVDNMQSVR